MWRICGVRAQPCHYRNVYRTHLGRNTSTARWTAQCRKCGATVAPNNAICFFCQTCQWPIESNVIAKFNAFEVFQLPLNYRIDKAQLNQQYKSYQFTLHPDKHASKQDEEIDIINSNASIVNSHYRTLLDDKQRARILFCIKYGKEEFDKGLASVETSQLEEIMEIHEKIESLQDPSEAKIVQQEFEEVIASAVKALEEGFESDDKTAAIKHFKTLSFYMQLLEKVQNIAGNK